MKEYMEFRDLESFAAFLGYAHPEEIHIVAHYEGFYDTDEQGDKVLSMDGINDFLRRCSAEIVVESVNPFIYAHLLSA